MGRRNSTRVIALMLAATSCAGVTPATKATVPLSLSVQGLICLDCGGELEEVAKAQPGVTSAHFDAKKIELAVELESGTSPDALVRALQAQPIDGRPITIVVGAGQGRFAAFKPLEPTWDARVLSAHGEDVATFQPTSGRVTVVDFFADWCGPCHELDDAMHTVLEQQASQVAYRRLNVVDWESPLAKHYLSGVESLPFVIVLGRDGKEVARFSGYKPEALRAAISKGSQP